MNKGSRTRSMYVPVKGEEDEPAISTEDVDLWEDHWTRIMGAKRFEDHPKAIKPERALHCRPWA